MSVLTQIQINTGSGDPVEADIGAKAVNVSYDNGTGQADTTVQAEISNLKTSAVKKLDDLTDVTIDNTLADGQTLVYDETNHVFKNSELKLDDLTDVTIDNTLADGQTLIYDGTNHVFKNGESNKMNIDGSNADDMVTFDGAFTVGSRTEDSIVGENSVAIGNNVVASGSNSVAIGDGVSATVEGSFIEGKNGVVGVTNYNIQEIDYKNLRVELPQRFQKGCAVVYNNQIHLLGGYNPQLHLCWNGTSWEQLANLPFTFGNEGTAVVYDDEIHVFGGPSLGISHWKWNGTQWRQAPDLPSSLNLAIGPFPAIVYKNKIYFFCWNSTNQYVYTTFNGSGWSAPIKYSTSTNFDPQGSSVTIYNGNIHFLGSIRHFKKHYSFDGDNLPFTEWANLPYDFYLGAAVNYNNEIYIIGGGGTSTRQNCYKWTEAADTWTILPDTELDFSSGSAVVYNDEIYILGGIDNNFLFRKFKKEQDYYHWNYIYQSNTKMPYRFIYGSAVVYNDEIYILGGYSPATRSCYKYNESNNIWSVSQLNILPYDFYESSAVVCNNEIHLLGGYNNRTAHWKWNGTSWEQLANLPYSFYGGSVVVYNNEIHLLGGNGNRTAHWKWNGTSWEQLVNLPYSFYYGGSAVVYNNEIHLLGGTDSNLAHWKWNGASWEQLADLPYNFYYGSAVVYNNEIHLLGGNAYSQRHAKWNGYGWSIISGLGVTHDHCCAVVYNNKIYLLGCNVLSYTYFGTLENTTIASQTGKYGHAEGYKTYVSADNSHAEGNTTVASGNNSHAEGNTTIASGNNSHAGGQQTTASGANSFAHGYKIESNQSNQFSIGSGSGGHVVSNSRYSSNATNNIIAKGNIFNLQSADIVHTDSTYGNPDATSNELMSIDTYGNMFLTGAIYKARGKLEGVLVADGRNIRLDPGALYLLFIGGWTTATQAYSGMQTYLISAGIGSSTTALAVPKTLSLGTAGTACKLSTTYTGSNPYYPVLGIGCCNTKITIRYTLVKVSGSTSDFA